jgi:hypothetical protein
MGSKKRARVTIDHGPRKIDFASATRLSRIFGTRGFPPYPFEARGLPPTSGERRPTITRGLALSTISSMKLFPDAIRSNKNANQGFSTQLIDIN